MDWLVAQVCGSYQNVPTTYPVLLDICTNKSNKTTARIYYKAVDQVLQSRNNYYQIYTQIPHNLMCCTFPSFLNMSSSLLAFFPSSTWSLMWSLVVHFSSLKHHQYNSQFFIPMSQVSQPGLVWFGSWLQCAIDSFTASVLSRPFSNRKTSPIVDSVAVPVTTRHKIQNSGENCHVILK